MIATNIPTETNWDPADLIVNELENLRCNWDQIVHEVIQACRPQLDSVLEETICRIRRIVNEEALAAATRQAQRHDELVQAAKALGVVAIRETTIEHDGSTATVHEALENDPDNPWTVCCPDSAAERVADKVVFQLIHYGATLSKTTSVFSPVKQAQAAENT